MTKKMIFIQYNADDMLNGCRLLSGPAELVYRRICDHIYTSNNNLFDEDITWNVLTEKFNWDHQLIKDELIRKNKIYIDGNTIRNGGCNKAIDKALYNHESAIIKGKKGAEAKRSSASSSAKAEDEQTINYELLTINNKQSIIKYKHIMETWNRIAPTSHIQQMNDTRKNLFRSRFKTYFKEDYKEWENFLIKISKMSFLWGSNDRGWKADFNWVLNENNLLKILEGKYESDKKDSIPSSESIYETRLRSIKNDKITPFLKDYAQKYETDVREAVRKKHITKERAEELGIKIG